MRLHALFQNRPSLRHSSSITSIAKIIPPKQSKASKFASSKSNSMFSRNQMRIKLLFSSKFPISISLRISSTSKRNHGKFSFSKRIIVTTIMITSHTLTIEPKTVRITILIIIKDGILILILITIMRVASMSLSRGMLFNMLKPSDQSIDTAHHLIELPVDVGALVINKFLKFILGDTFIEVRRGLPSFT